MILKEASAKQSVVLLHLSEDVDVVRSWLAFRANFEHERYKHISAWLLNINLNTSNDADFNVRDGFYDLFNILLSD